MRPEEIRNGKTSFSDMAYRYIFNGILSMELKPGDSLRVRDLAPLMSISPTPIERALERLAGEGLVEFKPGKGPFVAEATVEEVLELYDVRMMFELFAVERGIDNANAVFLRMMDELVDRHQAACEALKENYSYRLHVAQHEADRDLHQHITSLWPNSKVQNWFRQANIPIKAFQVLQGSWFYREASFEEHREIRRALGTQNAEAAKRAVELHEAASKKAFLERLAGAKGKH